MSVLIILCPPKSGSTSLWIALNKLKGITADYNKEQHVKLNDMFFSKELSPRYMGIEEINDGSDPAFDASTGYWLFIDELIKNSKGQNILVVLRNPYDRLKSNIVHNINIGIDTVDISKPISWVDLKPNGSHFFTEYRQLSLYSEVVEKLLKSDRSIQFLRFDDIVHNNLSNINKLLGRWNLSLSEGKLLKLNSPGVPRSKFLWRIMNEGKVWRKLLRPIVCLLLPKYNDRKVLMSKIKRLVLKDIPRQSILFDSDIIRELNDDIDKLENLLKWNLSDWRQKGVLDAEN